jgi:23S rRNA (cytosine1962-C5)-methyltransferase
MTMAAVYLHSHKTKPIAQGHPWVFPKAIARSTGALKTGELISVHTAEGEVIGWGAYNEHSLYRVRLLAYADENGVQPNITDIINRRLSQAISLRRLIGLPNKDTDAYRLCNSEGDGLSGLTIDVFGDIIVVSSSAFWVEANRSNIEPILQKHLCAREIIWISQSKTLQQDGWNTPAVAAQAANVKVKEAGIAYHIDFQQTQKTGLYLDQRENHQRIAALAQGKRVLDLYCFTGGFALHAAKAGAKEVLGIDSSAAAIAQATQNAELNSLSNVKFMEADVRENLAMAADYDIIILDPPKLVPSRKHLNKAVQHYRFLHREIFNHCQPGSMLLTCNCSSALALDHFIHIIGESAAASHKHTRILGTFGAGPDHPMLAAFPEGNYLQAVLLAII